MDNKYTQSANYVTLLMAMDIIAILFVIISAVGINVSLALTSIISVCSSIISIYAVYMLYRIWGNDFKKAFYCVLISSIIAILLYIFVMQSSMDFELLALILLVAGILSLVGYYFMLTAFAALCYEMNSPELSNSFIKTRSLLLIAVLVGVLISFVFSGRLNLMVQLVIYGVRVYIIYLYYRLRTELLNYQVDAQPDQIPDI